MVLAKVSSAVARRGESAGSVPDGTIAAGVGAGEPRLDAGPKEDVQDAGGETEVNGTGPGDTER